MSERDTARKETVQTFQERLDAAVNCLPGAVYDQAEQDAANDVIQEAAESGLGLIVAIDTEKVGAYEENKRFLESLCRIGSAVRTPNSLLLYAASDTLKESPTTRRVSITNRGHIPDFVSLRINCGSVTFDFDLDEVDLTVVGLPLAA